MCVFADESQKKMCWISMYKPDVIVPVNFHHNIRQTEACRSPKLFGKVILVACHTLWYVPPEHILTIR